MTSLEKKTVAELKVLATKKGVPLKGLRLKADIIKALNIASAPSPPSTGKKGVEGEWKRGVSKDSLRIRGPNDFSVTLARKKVKVTPSSVSDGNVKLTVKKDKVKLTVVSPKIQSIHPNSKDFLKMKGTLA
jgi:hypothetical protein